MTPASESGTHPQGLVIAVDASRNRSGGGKTHLINFLQDGDPREYGIREVHVWAYRALLDALPERPWLIKHGPAALEGEPAGVDHRLVTGVDRPHARSTVGG